MNTADFSIRLEDAGAKNHYFDSAQWLLYFQENRRTRPVVNLPQEVVIAHGLRKPLLQSLKKFQIGETSDGLHLKKVASRVPDPAYRQSIDLFVKEEQMHGQILAEVIRSLNGTLLEWHWTDFVFRVLRKTLGVKLEIMVLFIAEVIGKVFYRAVADNINKPVLSNVFSLIVLDEIAHLTFHTQFLASQLRPLPRFWRRVIGDFWSFLFYGTCLVFVADHRVTLRALHVSRSEFIWKCSREFHRALNYSLNL